MFIDFTARAAHCRSGSIGDGSEEQKGAAEGLLEYRKILAGVKLLRQSVLAVMDWSKQRSDHLRDHLQRKRQLAGASLTGTTLHHQALPSCHFRASTDSVVLLFKAVTLLSNWQSSRGSQNATGYQSPQPMLRPLIR